MQLASLAVCARPLNEFARSRSPPRGRAFSWRRCTEFTSIRSAKRKPTRAISVNVGVGKRSAIRSWCFWRSTRIRSSWTPFSRTKSNASPALKLMKAGFPWSREVYALVTERLLKAGARVVCFDLLFPSAGAGDSAFHEALEKYRDRVLRVAILWPRTMAAGCPGASICRSRRSSRARGRSIRAWATSPFGPIPMARCAARVSRLRWRKWPDQISRRAKFFTRSKRASSAPSAGPDLIPPAGDRLFRFAGGPRTFESHPIYEVFVPEMWSRNYQDGAFFNDKIVFIGPEGSWSHDEHSTPFRIIDGTERSCRDRKST